VRVCVRACVCVCVCACVCVCVTANSTPTALQEEQTLTDAGIRGVGQESLYFIQECSELWSRIVSQEVSSSLNPTLH